MTIQINEMALLSEKEVQEIYKLNARTLQRDRVLGRGIPYVKIGRRVRYKRSDIEKYIKRHTVGDHRYD
jgi:predicted DNA-binding transcriptional regulator AlpA